MTAKVINLRSARKRKARAEADRQATENRAKFGRTKAEKSLDGRETENARRHLDGHRIDPPDDA